MLAGASWSKPTKLLDSTVFHGGRTADHPIAVRLAHAATDDGAIDTWADVYVQHNVSTMIIDKAVVSAMGGADKIRPYVCKYRLPASVLMKELADHVRATRSAVS